MSDCLSQECQEDKAISLLSGALSVALSVTSDIRPVDVKVCKHEIIGNHSLILAFTGEILLLTPFSNRFTTGFGRETPSESSIL